jgi:hypothetical protein
VRKAAKVFLRNDEDDCTGAFLACRCCQQSASTDLPGNQSSVFAGPILEQDIDRPTQPTGDTTAARHVFLQHKALVHDLVASRRDATFDHCSGYRASLAVAVSVLEAPALRNSCPAPRHATSFTSNGMCISSQGPLG